MSTQLCIHSTLVIVFNILAVLKRNIKSDLADVQVAFYCVDSDYLDFLSQISQIPFLF